MLKLPSKYFRGQGVVYKATGHIYAGQVFFVEGDKQTVKIKVQRERGGCLRKRDVVFTSLKPLWSFDPEEKGLW